MTMLMLASSATTQLTVSAAVALALLAQLLLVHAGGPQLSAIHDATALMIAVIIVRLSDPHATWTDLERLGSGAHGQQQE
jgi:hypothetical protein